MRAAIGSATMRFMTANAFLSHRTVAAQTTRTRPSRSGALVWQAHSSRRQCGRTIGGHRRRRRRPRKQHCLSAGTIKTTAKTTTETTSGTVCHPSRSAERRRRPPRLQPLMQIGCGSVCRPTSIWAPLLSGAQVQSAATLMFAWPSSVDLVLVESSL